MEIGNSYSSYAAENTKEGNIITSTVELKTSTPNKTRTEQIKTGFSNVNDYSSYLQDKYSYMNTGTTSMEGVPTTVSVSGAFLKKCMNDPEKAKYLEENLAAIPDCAAYAVSHSLGTLTSLSYQIDANGNISCMSWHQRSGGENSQRKCGKEGKRAESAKRKAGEEKSGEERAGGTPCQNKGGEKGGKREPAIP